MKKVCHMTSAHTPGDTRIFYKECTSLAKAGYEVYLVQRGESGTENGVHIVGVGQPSGSRLARMTIFAKKVYRAALALDADIYHFHDPELLPYGLKLKQIGKRVIFDSHEFTAEAILEKGWIPRSIRNIVHRFYKAYEYRICRQLDGVITVSPHLQNYFQKANPNTMLVTNYPIINELFKMPDFSQKYIGFAGGVTSQWMHVNVLKALEYNPDCRYTLCGPCRDEYRAQLEALPGWAQTDYLGKIPHVEVSDKLSHCFAGVALLRSGRNTDWKNGTMGNTKIFEEMMAGLPVICSKFNLWKEFVDRYRCGICVDPENVEEIASAIRYLLDHPNEARKMGENGRRAVTEEFNWGKEEKKLLAMYDEIFHKISKGEKERE